MFMTRNRILAVGLVALVVALIALATTENPVFGQRPQRFGGGGMAAPPAHYTVVMTEAHNLLVTDNASNKLYFYTIDKDKPIGSPTDRRQDSTWACSRPPEEQSCAEKSNPSSIS